MTKPTGSEAAPVAPKTRKPAVKVTPREKAQAALDLIDRKIERLEKKVGPLEMEVAVVRQGISELVQERAYVASHPALQPQNPIGEALTDEPDEDDGEGEQIDVDAAANAT